MKRMETDGPSARGFIVYEGQVVRGTKKKAVERTRGETSFIVKSRGHRGLSLSTAVTPCAAFLSDTPLLCDVHVAPSIFALWLRAAPPSPRSPTFSLSTMSVNCR